MNNALKYAISVLLFCAVCSQAQGRQELGVVWTQDLVPYLIEEQAREVSDFRRLLDASWNDHLTVILTGAKSARRDVGTCNQLLTLSAGSRIRNTIPPGDYANLRALQVACEAMMKMDHMQPAEATYIGFDVSSMLRQLSDLQIPSAYGPYRLFFKSLHDFISVNCGPGTSCSIDTKDESFLIIPLALGDYNNDGVQDLMLQANSGPRIGSGNISIGIVVTRSSQGGALSILDWWD